MNKVLLFSMIMVFALAACSEPTLVPTPTAVISANTPNPPTSTPLPTDTETPTPTPEPTPTETPTPEPVSYGPDNFPATINPLTGLQVSDPALLDRRPISFKINLYPRSVYRPVWGLSLADIVYDYYHNDGYTRLHAIFYGNDAELVGAIRSGRLLDVDLVRMYQSIFAYGSADVRVNSRLLNSEFGNRLVLEGASVPCPPTAEHPLCRIEPKGKDLLLGGTKAITEYIVKRGVQDSRQDLNGMTFHSIPPTGGNTATQASVRYSGDDYARWDYDPATGTYLRFQDNFYDQGSGEQYAPLMDQTTEKQISAANVVFLVVRHEYFQQPPAEIIDILLSGTGKAYALRDGQIYEATWNRPTLNSVLYLTLADGSRFPFKPGSTWFQVIGQSSQVTEPEDGVWRFKFIFP